MYLDIWRAVKRAEVESRDEGMMTSFEAVADIAEDGTLRVRAPSSVPAGKRRVVVVIDDGEAADAGARRRLPDLSEFRARLDGGAYPGNSVVDMRR